MTSELTTWLQRAECYDVLLNCADFVIGKARRSAIQLDLLFQEEIRDNADALPQVVAGQLWQFLKERGDRVVAAAAERLVRNDMAGFMSLLADSFLVACLEERRTYAVNPSYAYYRHLRHVLSKAEDVRYEATRRGSFYAYSAAPDLATLPQDQWHLSYGDWPNPAVPFKEIHEKPAILRLSRFYWDETVVRLVAEYLLPVKELNRFVVAKYPLGHSVSNETSLAPEDRDADCGSFSFDEILVTDAHNDVLGSMARQNPRLDCDVIETELETLAQDTLAELTDRQRTILLRVDEGATLDEIARELGEKGASNIHYHLKKAYQAMKRKWSLWGPPSLAQFSEVEEEEFFIFYDKVIELCKNGGECRTT